MADAAVDVIILSWNRVAGTLAAIESALAQRDVRTQVIVVDQGSAAANLDRLRRFTADRPAILLDELGRNVGVAEGRNRATGLGTAPYVVSLDNDAVFADPHVLARAVRRLEAEPHLGALAFRIVNAFTRKDEFVAVHDVGAESWTILFAGAGHALRRRAFEAAGGYDDALFFGGEERDVAYRMVNAGYRLRYVPEIVVLHQPDAEGHLSLRDGRYYYGVRNRLYTDYKFGASSSRLLRGAAVGVIQGGRNGFLLQVLQAVADARVMARRHARFADREPYRLSDTAWTYIRTCERAIEKSFWMRLRRMLGRLPEASPTAGMIRSV